MSTEVPTSGADWPALQRMALLIGGVGLVLCLAGLLFSAPHFFRAYLIAFLFWLGIALGCSTILMIQYLTGGRWGIVLRRLLEAGMRTMPLLALLFIPLGFGLYHLYAWTGPIPADDAVLEAKTAYLNVPFFIARTLAYFVVWLVLGYCLSRWSAAQDREFDPERSLRIQHLCAPGLIAYGLTITFAAIDWIMSLEPHWFSSIFGVTVGASQILLAMAFVVLALALLARRPPVSDFMTPALWNDLGNLLLAFVMIWTYVSFSQYLLIWSGNLPEEIVWYKHRMEDGWEWVAWLLIVCNFAVPFIALLMRDVKRRPERLVLVAGSVLVMGFVYQVWLIAPSLTAHGVNGSHGEASGLEWIWLDAAALCAVGGLWLALFVHLLASRPLTPRPDPQWQLEAPHA